MGFGAWVALRFSAAMVVASLLVLHSRLANPGDRNDLIFGIVPLPEVRIAGETATCSVVLLFCWNTRGSGPVFILLSEWQTERYRYWNTTLSGSELIWCSTSIAIRSTKLVEIISHCENNPNEVFGTHCLWTRIAILHRLPLDQVSSASGLLPDSGHHLDLVTLLRGPVSAADLRTRPLVGIECEEKATSFTL